jgi:hypothetical protein
MPVTDRQREVANRRRFPLLEHRCATEGANGAIWNLGDEMPRKPKPIAILGVDSLSVSERVLLFCVASDTDPIKAGVSSATQVMILKNLLERDQGGHLVITDFGRRVLESLIN